MAGCPVWSSDRALAVGRGLLLLRGAFSAKRSASWQPGQETMRALPIRYNAPVPWVLKEVPDEAVAERSAIMFHCPG
eukprot:11528848-Alexandrium_andersonii.AAC.1